jgi:hypothetical protein
VYHRFMLEDTRRSQRRDITLIVIAAVLISIAFVLDLTDVFSSRGFLLAILIVVVVLGATRMLWESRNPSRD